MFSKIKFVYFLVFCKFVKLFWCFGLIWYFVVGVREIDVWMFWGRKWNVFKVVVVNCWVIELMYV